MGPATDLSQHGDYHAQVEKCRQAVTLSIKTLLETKHLYQRALVTFPPLIVTVTKTQHLGTRPEQDRRDQEEG